MATTSHKKSHLSAAQKLAIASLVSGATDQEAAAAAAVSRETVNRWRNGNPHFLAALNKLQLEIWEDHKRRLLGVVSDAVQTITEEVRSNPGIAMRILKRCRGFDVIQPPSGPTDVVGVLRGLALKRAEEELAAIREEESKGQFFISDPFEYARELAPLIKKHFAILQKKHGIDK